MAARPTSLSRSQRLFGLRPAGSVGVPPRSAVQCSPAVRRSVPEGVRLSVPIYKYVLRPLWPLLL